MNELLAKIAKTKIPVLMRMTSLQTVRDHRCSLDLDIDYDVSKYEKGTFKEYYVRCATAIEGYGYAFDIELVEFGILFDESQTDDYLEGTVEGELVQSLGAGAGELTLSVDREEPRQPSVTLHGSISGDGFDIDIFQSRSLGVLNFYGVSETDSATSTVFQDLVLEAYAHELEGNAKVSFMTYFSAIEAFVTEGLGPIKQTLFKELHDALEFLKLDDKLRILGRHSLGTQKNLEALGFWGPFMGLLRQAKDHRNKIAHGQAAAPVSKVDLDAVFACVTILYSFSRLGLQTFSQIRGQYYPPKRRR